MTRGRTAAHVAVTGALLLATPQAQARAIYFHKAGVPRELYVRDYGDCDALAGGVRVAPQIPYSSNVYGMAAGAFFAGFFGSRERRAMVDNVLRTCMADKGYRRVAAPDALRRDLSRLKDDARVDRLFEIAAAPTPQGEVLPR